MCVLSLADGLLPPDLAEQVDTAQRRLDEIRARAREKLIRAEERKVEARNYRQFRRQADMRRVLRRAHSEGLPLDSEMGPSTVLPNVTESTPTDSQPLTRSSTISTTPV